MNNNEINTEVVTITPELAKDFLQQNTQNRPMDSRLVATYAADIRNGRWLLSGEPIIISSENVILDGQHRLAAVVAAGKPIKSLFVWGITPEAFKVIDVGKARTAGDIIHIAGMENATNAAAAISKYFTIRANYILFFHESPNRLQHIGESKQRVLEFYQKNTEVVSNALRHAGRCYAQNRAMTKSNIAGYEIFLIVEKGHEAPMVEDFFMQICSGENITNITTKTMYSILKRKVMKTAFYTAPQFTAYLHKSWNAFVRGVEISALKYIPEIDGRYIELV